MKIKELQAILQKENVYEKSYSLLKEPFILAPEGYIVEKGADDTFYLFFSERDELELEAVTKDEDEICNAFLKAMSPSYPTLKKYIQ